MDSDYPRGTSENVVYHFHGTIQTIITSYFRPVCTISLVKANEKYYSKLTGEYQMSDGPEYASFQNNIFATSDLTPQLIHCLNLLLADGSSSICIIYEQISISKELEC